MPYIGNVLTSFAVETGNINDQAVTAPKLSATGGTDGQVLALDSNLNLEWVSDPAGQWVTSGSNIYYNDGNVGIGTSSPSNILSLDDTQASGGVGIDITNQGDGGSSTTPYVFINAKLNPVRPGGEIRFGREGVYGSESTADSFMAFYTAVNSTNTERLRIDSLGDIKHTGSTGADETNKRARYVVPSHDTNEEDVVVFQVENESSSNQITFGGGTSLYNAATQILFRTASAVDTVTGTERMRIDSAGSVGIGTTSPSFPSGTGLAIHHSTASRFKLTNDTTGTGASDGAHLYTSGGDFIIENKESANMRFYTSGSERMRIDSSGRLLVGTSSSLSVASFNSHLQIEGTAADAAALSVTRHAASTAPSRIILGKSRGTSVGSSTVVQSGDSLGEIRFAGADGTNINTQAASILCSVDGSPGSNDMPGRLVFSTTADGASSPTERMRIDSSGNVGIGLTSPDAKLEVKGTGDLSGSPFEYLYSTDSGIKVTGNESAVDLVSTDAGNHASSLLLRGVNKGFGFVNAPDDDMLYINSFTASGNDFNIHGTNGDQLSAFKKIVGFRKTGGITFNGETTDNHTLDDYEQGTWNPNVKFGNSATGVTYSEQEGTYVKIGNLVWLNMVVTLTNNGTGTGTCTVDLPFASGANSETRGAGSLSLFSGFANIRSQPVTYISGGNQTTMRFMHIDSSAGTADTTNNLDHNNITNSASWRGFIIYNTF